MVLPGIGLLTWLWAQMLCLRGAWWPGYADRMEEATTQPTADDFRHPFIGHLPGYPEAAQASGTDRPSEELYNQLLMEQWRLLVDSEASRDEKVVQEFLERHPTLLPGSNTVDGDSGHAPFPEAVISKPKLPGISDREPDFVWIASDSEALYPILIEIESPHKQWFYGDRAEVHSEFTHAHGQLHEWEAWFNQGNNAAQFLDDYEIPLDLRRRTFQPRFVLIYGRRANFKGSQRRQRKRGQLARPSERLMSFDRLTPAKHGVLYSCVRKRQDGYQVVAVPPSLTLANDGCYACSTGWDHALDSCPDMPDERRDYLKREMAELLAAGRDKSAEKFAGLTIYRPRLI